MALSKHFVELPNGITGTITVPSELEPQLVAFALRIFLGGFLAITKCESSLTKRDFLIRYLAALAEQADTAIRSTQMANKMDTTNHKAIVEDLLKTLDHH